MNWKLHLARILPVLKNKYFIAGSFFIVWITFFDSNNLIDRWHFRKQLRELEQKREYYLQEIEKNKQDLEALMGNKAKLEKFAREKYLMKKDDEEIIVFVKKERNS
jgi:cell division protein FtsB